MGVRGLQTYIEKSNAHQKVFLPDMVNDYKKRNPNKQQVVVVVDGSNCARRIYGESDWVCSGQWQEFQARLQSFIEAFLRIGIRLVFFFDGMTRLIKPYQITRRLKEFKTANKVFDCIGQKKTISNYLSIIPANFIKLIQVALEDNPNVTVFHITSDVSDKVMATYAAKHNCMAILAQDSDYVIYQTAPYISIEHLDLKGMTTVLYCRDTFCKEIGLKVSDLPLFACLVGNDCISRENLKIFHVWVRRSFKNLPTVEKSSSQEGEAVSLNLSKSTELPNSTKSKNAGEDGIQDDLDHAVANQVENYLDKLIPCLVNYISSLKIRDLDKELDTIITKIRRNGFGNAISTENLKEAVDMYKMNCLSQKLYRALSDTKDELKRDASPASIQNIVLLKTVHVQVMPFLLGVLMNGRHEFSVTLEKKGNITLVPCVFVYRPIRRRLYTLIFAFRDNFIKQDTLSVHNKFRVLQTDKVEETFVNSPSNVATNKITPLPLSLSDYEIKNCLYEFLIQKDDKAKLHDKMWKVLKEVVGVTISLNTLITIPNNFKALCIVLNYLIKNRQVSIELWEIEAFLAQAVHPMASNTDWHLKLQVEPYNGRAVHLAALFLRGIGSVLEVSSICGSPIENKYFIPWHYFDGKRFHYCYVEMERLRNVSRLLSNEDSSLMTFEILKRAVLEGVNLKPINTENKNTETRKERRHKYPRQVFVPGRHIPKTKRRSGNQRHQETD